MALPEERARETIDKLLEAAGWKIQDYGNVNLGAGRGVAVREFPLKTGAADYLLFVDRKAIGAVEAKPAGTTLSGVAAQSEKYSEGVPDKIRAWRKPLPFLYESTGIETNFTNGLDPEPRSRRVFAFHRPDTLTGWMDEWDKLQATLRSRLQHLPPLVTGNLWTAQIEAITNLELSLAADRPRALIQMATGSGKTFTAVNFSYRLIKFGGARRILFLVDRSNLGRQTLKEFQQFVTPDDGRKFTELYNVQNLASNVLDPVCRVSITTIQRLYSILSGEPELPPELEEQSLFELEGALGQDPKSVAYNPGLPIEYFDVIVTDECHRSIYNLWRQCLEYFDAYLIGLTATPSKQTFGFFNQNLVMEYSRERAVIDGVNVDGQVYRIRTEITERGSTVEAGAYVDKRHRQTRKTRWEELDDDLVYDARQLDREVVSESQIRTVIRAFRDRLPTDIFPQRTDVPKTLIFAKDDSHAEDIVRIVREEFGKGNDFCQKITYRVSGIKPEDLIATFRNSYNPRIAVTVDMIATGTDIKPLEILLFMRSVKSRLLFEQMLGRGTRVINPTDLQGVTPDAIAKTHFVIVDAVGVVENPKADTQTLERKRSVPFDKLLISVALGERDEDTLTSLAGRLARLARSLLPKDDYAISAISGGKTLRDLATNILDALDPDKQREAAQAEAGGHPPSADQIEQAAFLLVEAAAAPFDDPHLRHTLNEIQQRNEQLIDRVSIDQVREVGFSMADTEKARRTVESFQHYIRDNRDEITALQLIFSQPYGQKRLALKQLKELGEQLKQVQPGWEIESLWNAYSQVEGNKVRGKGSNRIVTNLVSLVRHALQPNEDLIPYPEQVRQRYGQWLAARESSGKPFSKEQRWWLDHIADSIGVNLCITPTDFQNNGDLANKGGWVAASKLFPHNLPELLEELNTTLAA